MAGGHPGGDASVDPAVPAPGRVRSNDHGRVSCARPRHFRFGSCVPRTARARHPTGQVGAPGTLESHLAVKVPTAFVGYGFPEPAPGGGQPALSEWDGLRRIKASSLDRVVDDTWGSWVLPSQVCFGDSGGPTPINLHPHANESHVIAAVASDGGIGCTSPDYRARVDTAAVQNSIKETIRLQLGQ